MTDLILTGTVQAGEGGAAKAPDTESQSAKLGWHVSGDFTNDHYHLSALIATSCWCLFLERRDSSDSRKMSQRTGRRIGRIGRLGEMMATAKAPPWSKRSRSSKRAAAAALPAPRESREARWRFSFRRLLQANDALPWYALF